MPSMATLDLVLCIGDLFGPVKDDGTGGEEVAQLLNGEIEGALPLVCRLAIRVNVPFSSYAMLHYARRISLPHAVIEKYASTSGEICKNVFPTKQVQLNTLATSTV